MSEAPQQTFMVKWVQGPAVIVVGSETRFDETSGLRLTFESSDGPRDPEMESNAPEQWRSRSTVTIDGVSYELTVAYAPGPVVSHLRGVFRPATPVAGGRVADPIAIWGSDDEPPVEEEGES